MLTDAYGRRCIPLASNTSGILVTYEGEAILTSESDDSSSCSHSDLPVHRPHHGTSAYGFESENEITPIAHGSLSRVVKLNFARRTITGEEKRSLMTGPNRVSARIANRDGRKLANREKERSVEKQIGN